MKAVFFNFSICTQTGPRSDTFSFAPFQCEGKRGGRSNLWRDNNQPAFCPHCKSLHYTSLRKFALIVVFGSLNWCTVMKAVKGRGKEMSLSRCRGLYHKLPKSDPYAVYFLPNAVYLIQGCFITTNIVWAG